MTLAALLFDMDGTLIDSMPLHERSWALWHAEMGLPYDESGFFAATAGRTNLEILLDLFPESAESERLAMAARKEALYRAIAERELTLIAGAREVIEVTYGPTDVGQDIGTLRLLEEKAGRPAGDYEPHDVPLRGTGAFPAPCSYELIPAATPGLQFGVVQLMRLLVTQRVSEESLGLVLIYCK